MVRKKVNSQLGQKIIITDKIIDNKRKDALLEVVQRQMVDSMVHGLIIGGKQSINISQESQRDASLRAFELITVLDTIDDDTYAALLGKMQFRQDSIIKAMESVNKIPWWRLLWLKTQGKKIVESEYA